MAMNPVHHQYLYRRPMSGPRCSVMETRTAGGHGDRLAALPIVTPGSDVNEKLHQFRTRLRRAKPV
uniref:Uncharacterized protein n=1 Tax=Rhizophora mucronata TaxID=61149 RepID=A0A2P2P576_RHIMU